MVFMLSRPAGILGQACAHNANKGQKKQKVNVKDSEPLNDYSDV